jgi:allophanate hydrolase subunit 2
MLDASLLPPQAGPIRIVLGPQDDYFTDSGMQTLLSSPYTITLQSDRMGYCLDGPEIEHSTDYNIVSDGIAPGSIQVPGTRKPIVLLADRQTTGGYPKIATVITADLSRLGQLAPGSVIRFEAVSIDVAEDEYIQMNRFLEKLSSLLEPAEPERLKTQQLLSANLINGVWKDK